MRWRCATVIMKGVLLEKNEEGLKRHLKGRHIRLMALGSTIGVGLFLGSATAIQIAGPSILLAYFLAAGLAAGAAAAGLAASFFSSFLAGAA